MEALLSSEWRVATIWECAIRGKKGSGLLSLADGLQFWLEGVGKTLNIRS